MEMVEPASPILAHTIELLILVLVAGIFAIAHHIAAAGGDAPWMRRNLQ
jgi:hypothetical protein